MIKIFPVAKVEITRTTIWVNCVLIEKCTPISFGAVGASGEILNEFFTGARKTDLNKFKTGRVDEWTYQRRKNKNLAINLGRRGEFSRWHNWPKFYGSEILYKQRKHSLVAITGGDTLGNFFLD